MKKKIGTVLEEKIFYEAKEFAASEGYALSELFQAALFSYLHENVAHNDSLRSCDKFCSHGSSLSLDEINEILQEDMLAL